MTPVPFSYRLAVGAAHLVSPALGFGRSKLARGIRGRRHALERLEAWGTEQRDPDRPTVWIHAPSVGEGLQAQAVMQELREARPEVQVVFTHFSPSAEALSERFGADVAAYLPWDRRRSMATALEGVSPNVVVFTKTEVWPVLAEEARRREVPVTIVAGSVPDAAGRRRWPARTVLAEAWRSMALACASHEIDGRGLIELGVPEAVVTVTGDPGVDSAAARAATADPEASFLAPFRSEPAPTVVAGSTWPSDEAVLMPMLPQLKEAIPALRIVLAPHEPTPDRVGALLGGLMEAGFHPSTLAHVEVDGLAGGVDAVVVDRVGVLAHLYTIGDVAYIGGGFHGGGLHSVLEPAAAGLPVLFGPRHHNASAASELVAAGGAAVATDSESLGERMNRWLGDRGARIYAGRQGMDYIGGHQGAAGRTARLLNTLL